MTDSSSSANPNAALTIDHLLGLTKIWPLSRLFLFQVVSGLPKTRSGKIMRRILRKVAQDKPEELGDVSTLADPSVVDEILEQHKELMARMDAQKRG